MLQSESLSGEKYMLIELESKPHRVNFSVLLDELLHN